MQGEWMLYGATGYTGRLIAEAAAARGLDPVLAGRDAAQVARIAWQLGLQHRSAGLDDPQALAGALQGMRVVLHCAGPFSRTAAPMRQAAITAGVHYLDITGEIDVFEAAHAQDAQARAAGVLLCPGVGFDVVPTDCVAATLKRALPDATELDLGFSGVDHMSAGTLVTSMEAVHRGCARVREGGRIVDVPFGSHGRMADFGRGEERTFVIPWGDVATAWHTTGIPAIRVHVPWQSPGAKAIRALLPLRGVMAAPVSRRLAHALMRTLAPGPSERKRREETTRVWGEVRNEAGQVKRAVLETGNGYSVTVETALQAVAHVLAGEAPAGYRTPSQLLGAEAVPGIQLADG